MPSSSHLALSPSRLFTSQRNLECFYFLSVYLNVVGIDVAGILIEGYQGQLYPAMIIYNTKERRSEINKA
jgi:hypothetical protein